MSNPRPSRAQRPKATVSQRIRVDSDTWALARLGEVPGATQCALVAGDLCIIRLVGYRDIDGEVEVRLDVKVWSKLYEHWAMLVPKPANLGGVRWYWRCPDCRRTVKHLYLNPPCFGFACRECSLLSYWWSQQNRRPGVWLDRFLGMPGASEALMESRAHERVVENRIRRCESRRAFLRRKRALRSPTGSD